MKRIFFEETQKYTVFIAGALMAAVVFAILSVLNIGFHQPLFYHSKPDFSLLLSAVGCVIIAILINSQKLIFIIDEDEIHISFGIFAAKTEIPIRAIKRISVRKYNALKEFSGWGVRYNSTESCFTVWGSYGIEIELINNERMLVGTNQPEKVQLIIDRIFSAPHTASN